MKKVHKKNCNLTTSQVQPVECTGYAKNVWFIGAVVNIFCRNLDVRSY